MGLEKFPAQQELAHQGFPAGYVAVRFYPHTPDWFPASFLNPIRDLSEQFGIVFKQVFIKLGLALGKRKRRVILH